MTTTTLERSYAHCRQLNRRHGTTYYWSTYALPAAKRPHVWALYGFCRHADDIVDDLGDVPTEARARRAHGPGRPAVRGPRRRAIGRSGAGGGRAHDRDLRHRPGVLRAVPRSDGAGPVGLRGTRPTTTCSGYMDGSAAVIGEMLLPILEPASPAAFGHARDLGVAFQLTNFLRDVAEDLDRGRVYIPQEDLRRFGADPERRTVDERLAGAHALRDRPVPPSLPVGRPRHRAPAPRLGPLHPRRPRALRRHPRPHRGRGVRRVHEPRAGCRRGASWPPWPGSPSTDEPAPGRAGRPVALVAGAWLLLRLPASKLARPSVHAAPARQFRPASGPSVSVSVVIPARDEASTLPTLLGSLAALDPRPHEVIVVDDHSSDATAEVAARYGATVVAAPPLPDGWLGKPWAGHVGAGAATGDAPAVPRRRHMARRPTPLDRLVAAGPDGLAVGPAAPPHRARLRAGFGLPQPGVDDGQRGLRRVAATRRPAAFGPCLLTSRTDYERGRRARSRAGRGGRGPPPGPRYRAAGLPVRVPRRRRHRAVPHVPRRRPPARRGLDQEPGGRRRPAPHRSRSPGRSGGWPRAAPSRRPASRPASRGSPAARRRPGGRRRWPGPSWPSQLRWLLGRIGSFRWWTSVRLPGPAARLRRPVRRVPGPHRRCAGPRRWRGPDRRSTSGRTR